jgi:hypothetical protein
MSRILDNQLTDGGEVINLKRRRRIALQGRLFVLIYVSGWVDTNDIVLLEGLSKLKRSNDLDGNRTRDLPAYRTKPKLNSIVWVRERTTPTELLPLVGEVIANFCG